MAKKILIVEDEPDIADLVSRYLARAGFRTQVEANGEKAFKQIQNLPPDLLILDLMLPDMDGLELCRLVRSHAETAHLPIIMLTAKGEESDKLVGLEMGADDYVTKPFSPRELVARVRAVLRRQAASKAEMDRPLEYGRIKLDPGRHLVEYAGREVALTAKEFLLLKYLISHQGRVVSRDQLLNDVWGYDYVGGNRTVDVHVRHLRKKLPLLEKSLITIKSFGYKLMEAK